MAYLWIKLALYSVEPRTRKYVKWYRFLSFAINLSGKYWKRLLDAVTKTRLDAAKTAPKQHCIKELKQQENR